MNEERKESGRMLKGWEITTGANRAGASCATRLGQDLDAAQGGWKGTMQGGKTGRRALLQRDSYQESKISLENEQELGRKKPTSQFC